VRHISHDVMVMCLGRVVEAASRDAFYAQPLHPYSRALMEAVPEPDPVRERGRLGLSLPGELPSPLNPPPGCVFASRCPKVAGALPRDPPELREVAPGRLAACHFVEPDMTDLAALWAALPAAVERSTPRAMAAWAFWCLVGR
jgi:oligopeptide transport system ATP-binding protein